MPSAATFVQETDMSEFFDFSAGSIPTPPIMLDGSHPGHNSQQQLYASLSQQCAEDLLMHPQPHTVLSPSAVMPIMAIQSPNNNTPTASGVQAGMFLLDQIGLDLMLLQSNGFDAGAGDQIASNASNFLAFNNTAPSQQHHHNQAAIQYPAPVHQDTSNNFVITRFPTPPSHPTSHAPTSHPVYIPGNQTPPSPTSSMRIQSSAAATSPLMQHHHHHQQTLVYIVPPSTPPSSTTSPNIPYPHFVHSSHNQQFQIYHNQQQQLMHATGIQAPTTHANTKPVFQCENCFTTQTPMWRRDDQGRRVCNACGVYYRMNKVHRIVKPGTLSITRRRRRMDAKFSNTTATAASKKKVATVAANTGSGSERSLSVSSE